MGDRGAWHSVLPPPPDKCASCGAVAAGQSDVIEMVPTKQLVIPDITSGTNS